MSLKIFGTRPAPLCDRAAAQDFLDRNAAFVSQKAIFEYSRAAAGYLWQPLFSEVQFKEALERSRWLAYPRGVVLVAEVMEGILRPDASDQAALLSGFQHIAQAVFAAHEPRGVTPEEWSELTSASVEQIGRFQVRPVQAVKDIPSSLAEEIFAILPLHEKVRGRDPVLLRNNIIANLLQVHEDFDKQAVKRELALAIAALT